MSEKSKLHGICMNLFMCRPKVHERDNTGPSQAKPSQPFEFAPDPIPPEQEMKALHMAYTIIIRPVINLIPLHLQLQLQQEPN